MIDTDNPKNRPNNIYCKNVRTLIKHQKYTLLFKKYIIYITVADVEGDRRRDPAEIEFSMRVTTELRDLIKTSIHGCKEANMFKDLKISIPIK